MPKCMTRTVYLIRVFFLWFCKFRLMCVQCVSMADNVMMWFADILDFHVCLRLKKLQCTFTCLMLLLCYSTDSLQQKDTTCLLTSWAHQIVPFAVLSAGKFIHFKSVKIDYTVVKACVRFF